MATLIIGGHNSGGIGAAVVKENGFRGISRDSFLAVPSETQLDLRDIAKINQFFRRNVNIKWSRVVYCAGVNHPAMLGNLNHALLPETFHVNVIGFIRVLDMLKRYAVHDTKLSVVAVASDAATTAMRGSIAYCASKAALAQSIRCAAREMAPNWRVNGVAPSMVADTPMTAKMDELIPPMRGWTSEQAREYETSLVPMGRRCTKEEVARLVLDVLDGPEFMTGSIISITGGK